MCVVPSVVGPGLSLPANVFALKLTYLSRRVVRSERVSTRDSAVSMGGSSPCGGYARPYRCSNASAAESEGLEGSALLSLVSQCSSQAVTPSHSARASSSCRKPFSSSSPTWCWSFTSNEASVVSSPNIYSLAKMSTIESGIRGGF